MKVLLLVVVLAIVAIASADVVSDSFQEFMTTYNKQYASAEEQKARFEVFQTNYEKIQWLKATAKSATYGVTKFADLTSDEFAERYLTYRRPASYVPNHYPGRQEIDVTLPSSFDWRDKGAVTPVKNQGQCGSCWAFSATEAIESQWFLAGHTLPVLSEQQIVDCDTTDAGCNGGDTPTAYEYVISAGGIETESAYPYTAEDGQCTFAKAKIDATISNWTYITTNKNETEMQNKIVTVGPLSICVDAVTWQFYIEGVIAWGDLCYDSLDHCVMITGYNDAYDGYKVWNVRNSWGTDWGEDGYIFIERGYDLCGIADEVTIPLVQ